MSNQRPINKYSIKPTDLGRYLDAILETQKACGAMTHADNKRENAKLKTFMRGLYFKKDFSKCQKLCKDAFFLAMPIQDEEQVTAFECSDYVNFIQNQSEPQSQVDLQLIQKDIQDTLNYNNVTLPEHYQIEVSHHYGLDKFNQYGMCLITIFNEEYCKKVLVVKPGQTNPLHWHNRKKETFYILSGVAIINVDGVEHTLDSGEFITILPGQKHKISSLVGTTIEEISTNHDPVDSHYEDKTITLNINRKTFINV